ncbi:MAG: hypothetical protein ACE5PV_03000 [Candidatus Poribacteria bacterium]
MQIDRVAPIAPRLPSLPNLSGYLRRRAGRGFKRLFLSFDLPMVSQAVSSFLNSSRLL